jgi:CheY-like chemotaxis protein
MDDKKNLYDSIASEAYDATEKPFDFIEEGKETALICDPDSAVREKISNILQENKYLVTTPDSVREALGNMRFHVYQLIVINENFDTLDRDESGVLSYLESLPMNIRRDIFVVLISKDMRTTDKMAAFNKSVNLIVNSSNIDEIGDIIARGIAEHEYLYRIFKESMERFGRL